MRSASLQLGVRERAITVTGDTRYDQVWARAQRERSTRSAARAAAERAPDARGRLDMAGRRASISFPRGSPRARKCPTRDSSSHRTSQRTRTFDRIEQWAAAHHADTHAHERPPAANTHADVIVLVDRVGLLGDLYALADVAYVGGGFHGAGLHSVLEPAAFGVPVLFGPRHEASRDASSLLFTDAGGSVTDGSAITARLEALLTRPDTRGAEGARARAIVEKGLGASARSTALVTALL